MTLSSRNTVFKTGIAFSLVILIVLLAASSTALPFYPELQQDAAFRPLEFFTPAPLVPYLTMIAAVLYALVTLAFIFYYFEKTQSPEILFVAFFALSFAFEAARIMPPLRTALELPGVSLGLAQRFLLFGRYSGVFSIFAASICAAGLEMQSPRPTILIITLSALVIAAGIPVDGFSWDSSFSMIVGYRSMFGLLEAALALATSVSFIVAAHTRGSREYIIIGAGAFLAFLGRSLFIRADAWITPLPGLALLALGTLFICGKLRQVYLWL
jgi:hypothetical protein